MSKDIWESNPEQQDESIWESTSEEWNVPSEDIVFRVDGLEVDNIYKEEIDSSFKEIVLSVMKEHDIDMATSVKVEGRPLLIKDADKVDIEKVSFVDIYTKLEVKPETLAKKLEEKGSSQKYHTHMSSSGGTYSHLITEHHKDAKVRAAHNKTTPTIKQ